MATVSEIIPEALRPEVDAVLTWFNATQSDEFKATGILDPDVTLAETGTRELRLVLCSGDTCQQKSFRVTRAESSFDVALAEAEVDTAGEPTQDELDPPPGPRREWLDSVLSKHKFAVILFYRGFW
jgi:hypothetical protein